MRLTISSAINRKSAGGNSTRPTKNRLAGCAMKYRLFGRPTTRILWNPNYETYQCEKCKAIMHYNFDFALCPYCGRKITYTDERRAQTVPHSGYGVIVK